MQRLTPPAKGTIISSDGYEWVVLAMCFITDGALVYRFDAHNKRVFKTVYFYA